jgi:hypothetical protein
VLISFVFVSRRSHLFFVQFLIFYLRGIVSLLREKKLFFLLFNATKASDLNFWVHLHPPKKSWRAATIFLAKISSSHYFLNNMAQQSDFR